MYKKDLTKINVYHYFNNDKMLLKVNNKTLEVL